MSMVEFCHQTLHKDRMSMLKRFFEVKFFVSNVIVPMVVLALYCGSFAYFSCRFLLEGVNPVFAGLLGRYVLFATAGICLFFFVGSRLRRADEPSLKYHPQQFYPGDLLLVFLPLTPVAQYILNNQEILSPLESMYVLAFWAFFSSIYIFAIPALLGIFFPARTSMVLSLAFTFTITSMASLSDYFKWFEKGDIKVQLAFFCGIFALVLVLYNLQQRKILYLFVVASFVLNSSAQFFSHNAGADDPSPPIGENELLQSVENKAPIVTPNIYLLVYDAYVSNETMLGYGIDNSSQEDYLRQKGFELYPHTYSIGSSTLNSMSKVLNASEYYYGSARRGVSGDGVVQNALQDIGYETYGLFYSDFMFRGIGESYDYSFPTSSAPPYTRLLKAIFIGEFRFNVGEDEEHGKDRDRFIRTKQDIFESIPEKQVFVYTHSDQPGHSQNSGACRPNEIDLYKGRLANANIEMRQDIETIVGNDPGAIVIVAGDHGPSLTKNCTWTSDTYDISEISRLDIQDRYGTFLAIRWPTNDFVAYDDVTVLQDLFPSVFAYLYKDASILEAKVKPVIPKPNAISWVTVKNGIIYGGINDREPLFLMGK